jgi:hypothetical protein
VRAKGVRRATNVVLHPGLKAELERALATLPAVTLPAVTLPAVTVPETERPLLAQWATWLGP